MLREPLGDPRLRLAFWDPTAEDVPLAVELRDGDPVSELSQAGVATTSGAAVAVVMGRVSAARLAATSRSTATASLARSV